MTDKRFSVFVGGSEVNDLLLTKKEAEELLLDYQTDGYDDVALVEYSKEELEQIQKF